MLVYTARSRILSNNLYPLFTLIFSIISSLDLSRSYSLSYSLLCIVLVPLWHIHCLILTTYSHRAPTWTFSFLLGSIHHFDSLTTILHNFPFTFNKVPSFLFPSLNSCYGGDILQYDDGKSRSGGCWRFSGCLILFQPSRGSCVRFFDTFRPRQYNAVSSYIIRRCLGQGVVPPSKSDHITSYICLETRWATFLVFFFFSLFWTTRSRPMRVWLDVDRFRYLFRRVRAKKNRRNRE